MFCLDQLGLEHFGTIVKSLGRLKMHFFLDFFFSNITTWVQEEWNTIYEPEFVKKHWITPLLRWRPEINHLMIQLSKKEKKAPAKPTQCQEFNFSKMNLPTIPKREPTLVPNKFTPVPKSSYTTPGELQKILECKEKNKLKAEELLHVVHFRCGDTDKSEQVESVISQIKPKGDAKMKFESFRSKEIPRTIMVESPSVRLNNAAIWRREALHDRLVKEELHRIDELVRGSLDPSPFLQRLKDLEERERLEKRQAEERIRLETQIIEKEIILIRKRIAEQKHEAAQRKKEESARLQQIYAEQRLKKEKEIREQVMEGRIYSKEAQERIKKIKQKIVKEVSKESQELLRQALKEKEEELRKRSQKIREIHAIESLPIVRSKTFDETQTSGYQLLDEMSLTELKERLVLLRQSQQKEEEERRSNILEEKQKKKQQILETLDNINLYKKLLIKEAADRKEKQRVQQELLKQVVNEDETIMALKKKLEDKKQAFHEVKEVERSQAKPGKRLNRRASDRKELRETTWEELEQNLARYVQDAQ